jgi:predicted GNAT superfamily acetyltransferase
MIDIRPPADAEEIRQTEAIQQATWRMSDIDLTPYNVLHAWMHAGGILLCAFDGTDMVGFCASFPGEVNGKRIQWSHMTAVLPAYQRQGIGRQIKFAQRDASLHNGYNFIAWTYDPLRIQNAVFNIEILGAGCAALHPEFYGEMTDELNRGLVSDRFEVLWDLKDVRVAELASGKRAPFANDAIPPDFLLTSVRDEPNPIHLDEFDAPEYALQLPADLDGLRARSPELTHRWYHALRDVVTPLFGAGYSVDQVLMLPESFAYVLKRPPAWKLYILETGDGSLYTGVTTDLTRRLKEHNAGRGARYTKSRRPVKLLAAWETFGQGEALRLEVKLKRLPRPRKMQIIADGSDFRGARRVE